jgi:hypothetical protein
MTIEAAEQKRLKAEQRTRETTAIFEELRHKSEADAANMARLRALRLAKEAADATMSKPKLPPRPAVEAPIAPKKAVRKKTTRSKAEPKN